MALLLTLVILIVGLTALFWGGSLVLQTWLYNVPTTRLGLRAVASAAGVALFLTFWCWIDSKSPGKYDVLLSFSMEEFEEYDKVESVTKTAEREGATWKLGETETIIAYTMDRGGKGTGDFRADGNKWSRSPGGAMVVALRIQEKNRDQPTRFNAKLDPVTGGFPESDLRFVEERGSRYIELGHIGRVIRSRSSLFLVNVLLNAALFAVWLVTIWLGLRFTFGHAFGIAFMFWVLFELVVMQLLLQQTRPITAPPAPAAAIELRIGAPTMLRRV